ncbi:Spo0A-P phosphatase [Bacillus methanolicus]|uniref:aspartyl-phosphate phosphatase Spo0E family protein n=1 Tax=Bacillus methanolicus TaxID=1471 RepID=UPI0023805CD4|nr:aspartyl-phosphate phosphatase Spo0E family protein [Bacillus methanolicus]MDE3838626.1 Spo0A-P phosphatase [Bacillus methanolicus]
MTRQEFLLLIEKKRAELINVASKYGLNSSVAIKHSQELDHLLNEYNRSFLEKLQPVN